MDRKAIKNLLLQTDTILNHQKEVERLKGESFNLFNILNVESKEDNTHTAFIAELLDPEGSHLLENVFLKHFLELSIFKDLEFDINSASVQTQFYIGRINDEYLTGGTIDLILIDKNGNTISIENKIYADDQENQLVRYYNYNTEKNTLIYLNLFGSKPKLKSVKHLILDKNYSIISYKNEILKWLEICFKEASSYPILRESIKQYIKLVKKLTMSMDNQEELALFKEMLNHYEAATYIALNLQNLKDKVLEDFRIQVYKKLESLHLEKFQLEMGNDTTYHFSQIWLRPRKYETLNDSLLGIESFSGKGNYNGKLFVGIIKESEESQVCFNSSEDYAWFNKTIIKGWNNEFFLTDFEGNDITTSDVKFMKKLMVSPEEKNRLVNHVVAQIQEYLEIVDKLIIVNDEL